MDRLDKIIAEQAAYYGLTVPQFERASRCMAAIAEGVTETDETYLNNQKEILP